MIFCITVCFYYISWPVRNYRRAVGVINWPVRKYGRAIGVTLVSAFTSGSMAVSILVPI